MPNYYHQRRQIAQFFGHPVDPSIYFSEWLNDSITRRLVVCLYLSSQKLDKLQCASAPPPILLNKVFIVFALPSSNAETPIPMYMKRLLGFFFFYQLPPTFYGSSVAVGCEIHRSSWTALFRGKRDQHKVD